MTGTSPPSVQTSSTFSDRVGSLLGLAARLVLGVVLIVAGLLKVSDIEGSVEGVMAYHLVSPSVARWIGIGLPVVEVVVGTLLITGLFVRVAGLLSAGLMVVFIVAIGSAWARGLKINCGCFGSENTSETGSSAYLGDLARDLGLTLLAGFLVARPKSRFALDVFVRGMGNEQGPQT